MFDKFVVIATLDPAKNAHGNDIKYFRTRLEAEIQAASYTADWWKTIEVKEKIELAVGHTYKTVNCWTKAR